jgi:phage-related protein
MPKTKKQKFNAILNAIKTIIEFIETFIKLILINIYEKLGCLIENC